jgi:hypothetical protein
MKRGFHLLILVAALSSLFAAGSVAGQQDISSGQVFDFEPVQAYEEQGGKNIFLQLQFPELSGLDIPPGLTRSEAYEIVRQQVDKLAGPAIDQLRAMQESGQIGQFEILQDQMAVAIYGLSPEAATQIQQMPGLVTLPAGVAPTCLQPNRAALVDQMLMHSQIAGRATSAPTAAPNFDIAIQPASGLTYVTGYADPNVNVSLSVSRNGQTIVTENATADAAGFYSFYPAWIQVQRMVGYPGPQCQLESQYAWELFAGDVVQIEYSSGIYTSVVASLRAWTGPEPRRGIYRPISDSSNPPIHPVSDCSLVENSVEVASDALGHFVAQFGDFDAGLRLKFTPKMRMAIAPGWRMKRIILTLVSRLWNMKASFPRTQLIRFN